MTGITRDEAAALAISEPSCSFDSGMMMEDVGMEATIEASAEAGMQGA